MECRFTYTPAEMFQAARAYRRLNLLSSLRACALLWLVLGAIFISSVCNDPAHPHPSDLNSWLAAAWDCAPLIIVPTVYTIFLFTPIWNHTSAYFFRRNPLCNQDVTYKLEDSGFTLQSPVLCQSAAWSAIGKAGESAQGFILFWGKSKRSFHWLPKHGFSSENEINLCRSQIQQHVAKFKRVG